MNFVDARRDVEEWKERLAGLGTALCMVASACNRSCCHGNWGDVYR
jgi:hypothetical protein